MRRSPSRCLLSVPELQLVWLQMNSAALVAVCFFVTAVDLIPLTWQYRTRSVPILCLIFWFSQGSFFTGLRVALWASPLTESLKVFCDISKRDNHIDVSEALTYLYRPVFPQCDTIWDTVLAPLPSSSTPKDSFPDGPHFQN